MRCITIMSSSVQLLHEMQLRVHTLENKTALLLGDTAIPNQNALRKNRYDMTTYSSPEGSRANTDVSQFVISSPVTEAPGVVGLRDGSGASAPEDFMQMMNLFDSRLNERLDDLTLKLQLEYRTDKLAEDLETITNN